MISTTKQKQANYWLYMLELSGGYFYIGITAKSNPQLRIQQHYRGKGAQWTKQHKPFRTLSLKPLGYISKQEAEQIEQKETRKFMQIHGYNNVRGGDLNFSGNYVKFQNRYIQTDVLHSHWV